MTISHKNRHDPPIQITVNDGGEGMQRVYTSGEIVSGTVRVDARTKTTRVSIDFTGSTTTRVSKNNGQYRQVLKARVNLFRLSSVLYSGGDIESLSSADNPFVSFPFTFRFPHEVRLAANKRFEKSHAFEHQPGHPLPPTLRVDVRNTGGCPCTIQYSLEATMANSSSKRFSFHNQKQALRVLNFTPAYNNNNYYYNNSTASATPDPHPASSTSRFTRHSHRLDPECSAAHHNGVRARLKDAFPSSKDPSATFAITTTAPTLVRAGAGAGAGPSSFPITLTLAHRDRSPELQAAEPPPVFLRRFRAALEARTRIRVPYASLTGARDIEASQTNAYVLGERRFGGSGRSGDDAPPLPADGTPLGLEGLAEGQGRAWRLGKDVAPTFRTYGIARTYALRVALWVECAGKVFEVKDAAPGHAVRVLAWPDAVEAEGADGLAGTGEGGGVEDAGEGAGEPPDFVP
ncbi:hypothetical protein B0J12DRAFT_451528 [Macrophomina phaseolina]|uniref:Arrestin-like N-terminal domain-containing protein n=1 Tax=Macrophomina phaseolina TaxID=35725 RepID=A0ABQ8GIE0_9PEZI|nr:hypothetical protein B0J12DRAFT_451528 [Macrophomina phaseolina]